MTTFRRGSLGPEVAQIQTRLSELGFYRGPVDGLFGGGTESAVRAFQASAHLDVDGLVGRDTWRALFDGASIPTPSIASESLDYRCLALTGAFETGAPFPDCFSGLAGDFDDQGISFGVLQWNFGQGSLPTLLKELDRTQPGVLTVVFQNQAPVIRAVLAAGKDDQLDWARSIQDVRTHRINEPWRGMFLALGQQPECQQLQVNAAHDRFLAAVTLATRFGLRTERAVALMFDVVVQNGGISSVVQAQIERDFAAIGSGNPDEQEVERMRVIGNRRADAARPQFAEDVRARKLTIATGKGRVHGQFYNLEEDYAIRLTPAPSLGGVRPRVAVAGLVLSDEEIADAEPARPGARAVAASDASAARAPLSNNQAAWPRDELAPDYRHIGRPFSDQVFHCHATVLERLCALNRFDTSAEREVIFGLRGCRLSVATAGFVDAVTLVEATPDHNDYRCVIGVWRRSDGKIAAFEASTVPNWKIMQQHRHGLGCNLMPTGFYRFRVGAHAARTDHAQPGALRQAGPIAVRRSRDDLSYTVADDWDFGDFGDNMHAGRFDLRRRTGGVGPYFSSAGCQTLPGGYENGRAVRSWGAFRDALGLTNPPANSDDGRAFSYLLLTGREARFVSTSAGEASLVRLRFGSRGPDVESLQRVLADAGFGAGDVDGRVGAQTVRALVAWQQLRDRGTADGIVTPAIASTLGFELRA